MNFFDLHCDTAYRCFCENLSLFSEKLSVNFNNINNLDEWHQSFAIWIEDGVPEPFVFYRKILSDFKTKLSKKPENLTPYFMVENAELLQGDIERIGILKRDGIKSLTLTWNGENCIAGGCKTDVGLKEFGIKVIKEMNRQKMACDLSHLNKASFYSAIQYAEYPYASHSCLEILRKHNRNISIEQAKLIAGRGGIIGICFYPDFLPIGDVFVGIYENISVLLDAGLENNIAIGSDFDGAKMDEKLDDISKIGDLYHFLGGKSLPKTILNKIFFENAFNFYTKL